MTDSQPILMRHLENIADRTDELGVVFYGLLETRHPSLMDSFGPESTQRTQMLTQILAGVHDSMYVEDAEWVALQLRALGRAHVDWKVTPEMYDQVCGCLVDALSQLGDSGWSPELEEVWTAQLSKISVLMHGQGRP
ncbi:MAG TPA: globin [Myxococcota bacterium]|nr:globin [Myxococcota bacterium]